MTDKELKKLKDDLWHSADVLRSSAHLAANKYGQPILGLIFLRYADILYKQHKEECRTYLVNNGESRKTRKQHRKAEPVFSNSAKRGRRDFKKRRIKKHISISPL